MRMFLKNVHITHQQNDALLKMYEITGIKPAEHIRRALDAYIKKEQQGGVSAYASCPAAHGGGNNKT